MSRAKKIVLFLGLALGFVLVAVSALVLFLPRLIDLESVKTKTTAAISEKTGAVVQLDQVSLSYFPRLRVTISGVDIKLSDDANNTCRIPQCLPIARETSFRKSSNCRCADPVTRYFRPDGQKEAPC